MQQQPGTVEFQIFPSHPLQYEVRMATSCSRALSAKIDMISTAGLCEGVEYVWVIWEQFGLLCQLMSDGRLRTLRKVVKYPPEITKRISKADSHNQEDIEIRP